MRILQTPTFERFVKKQTKEFKETLDSEVNKIASDPEIGEQKKGDLSSIWVHKFKFQRALFLLAYISNEEEIQLVMIGQHENFYRDLKKKM